MRILLQYLLPHKFIALLAHLSANCRIVWIKNYLIRYFIARYAVNMQEATKTNPFAYASYNEFFTRQLKPECRPIDPAADSIVSPADGTIAQIGNIDQDRIIQAKGHQYSLTALLGGDMGLAKQFMSGSFATIYLAPKDYHRVHMPFSGRMQRMIYVPGSLFSVNDFAAANIPGVFARNERVVTIFATQAGAMAVILVGAMIVGSIEMANVGSITPPHSNKIRSWEFGLDLPKGAELGLFKLGSTVITIFTPQTILWDEHLIANTAIKMGSKIGSKHESMDNT